jgi:hypothetical protein
MSNGSPLKVGERDFLRSRTRTTSRVECHDVPRHFECTCLETISEIRGRSTDIRGLSVSSRKVAEFFKRESEKSLSVSVLRVQSPRVVTLGAPVELGRSLVSTSGLNLPDKRQIIVTLGAISSFRRCCPQLLPLIENHHSI